MDQMTYQFRLRRTDMGFAPAVANEQGSRRSSDRKSRPATTWGAVMRAEDWQSVWEAVASDPDATPTSSLAMTEFQALRQAPARCSWPGW